MTTSTAPATPVATTTIRVRYFAGARAAAGVSEEDITLPELPSVEDVLDALRDRHGHSFAKVLTGCSFLLDEIAVRDRAVTVADQADLDVLPPFAGG
ncbi:MAG TPA: MoaD/ThiS family protein [Pseudonocardiaceae bacterium]